MTQYHPRPIVLFVASILTAMTATAPAATGERGYTITSFDRIRLEGPYKVRVTSGRGPSARAQGSAAALDAVTLRVIGRTLVIQRDRNAWGGYPGQDRGPVAIAVTVPGLVAAELAGSGDLAIDVMRNATLALAVAGSGTLAVGRVQGDRVSLGVNGSGGIVTGGMVATMAVSLNGSGTVDAKAVQASDATVDLVGSGTIALGVTRAVRVQSTGSGDIAITGRPACTIRRIGSGNVVCGG